MISYNEALEIIVSRAINLQTKKLPLLAAFGKIAAEDVISSLNVPSFRNSAMDGFAVCAEDVREANITLPIADIIEAGKVGSARTKKCAVQIMTGAPIPDGFDAVIPVEDAEIKGDSVTFNRPAKLNENVRFPGEDVRSGQLVLAKGSRITPEAIMLLSAIGVGEIKVCAVPRIHIISTGNEITDSMSDNLREGEIYNSNAPYLLARAAAEGFEAFYEGIIRDDEQAFEDKISSIEKGAVIISTGAVSKGSRDFIPDSIKKLGGKIHFHRVNIRPGKPILFATLPNGSFYFGLPGNPVSTAIGFTFFVLPLLRRIQGQKEQQPIMARLENTFAKKGDFRQFLKASVRANPGGKLVARISDGQESFKISPLASNNSWVMLEESRKVCEEGELVAVYPFKEVLSCKAA